LGRRSGFLCRCVQNLHQPIHVHIALIGPGLAKIVQVRKAGQGGGGVLWIERGSCLQIELGYDGCVIGGFLPGAGLAIDHAARAG